MPLCTHTDTISDRHGTTAATCEQTPSCVCTSRLFLPVRAERMTDHPPAMALPIDVSLASVGGQLMGFCYQHLSVATMSALPPPSRYTQSSKVIL